MDQFLPCPWWRWTLRLRWYERNWSNRNWYLRAVHGPQKCSAYNYINHRIHITGWIYHNITLKHSAFVVFVPTTAHLIFLSQMDITTATTMKPLNHPGKPPTSYPWRYSAEPCPAHLSLVKKKMLWSPHLLKVPIECTHAKLSVKSMMFGRITCCMYPALGVAK